MRFKIDILRTSQGRCHMNVFSGRFEDNHRTVLQNCNNMKNLIFQYFTQHIQWSKIENNTTVMCFLIYFQFGVRRTSQGHHFRTLLGLLWDLSQQFLSKWMNLFLLPGGTLNQHQFGKLLRRSWDVSPKCSKCKEL